MEMWNSLICLVLVWICTHFLRTIVKRSNMSTKRLPPGPLPLPIVGNIFKLGSKPHISLAELAKVYGSVFILELGHVTTVIVSSVDMAREVLQKNDASFSYRADLDVTTVNDHIKSSIVFLHPGNKWRAMRRICASHVFSRGKLDDARGIRMTKVHELISYVEECSRARSPVDIGQATFNTTLNILSCTFFSKDLADLNSEAGQEFKELVRGLMEVAGEPNIADFFPILKPFDLQGLRGRAEVLVPKSLAFFDGLINERLDTRKLNAITENNDILNSLLDIILGNNSEVELSDLSHLFSDLFTAGNDTTSSTIEWAMAELISHPDKMRIAQVELQDVIGRGNPIKEDDIGQLKYLPAVIKETLRLHPPVPFLVPRMVIADVKLGKFTVPKNARLLVNIWAMGRDPSIWERPNSFEPERFLGSNIDFKGHDFDLIPFGAGRRICPGLPLASRMLHLVIGSLIHSFDWKLEEGMTPTNMDMEEKFAFTLQRAQPLIAIPMHRC